MKLIANVLEAATRMQLPVCGRQFVANRQLRLGMSALAWYTMGLRLETSNAHSADCVRHVPWSCIE